MNLVPGSGCGSIDKEDLISRGHLGQVKSTRGDRISVSIKDLVLLDERAKENTKRMVFFLSFVKKNKRYAIIDLEEWIRMNR